MILDERAEFCDEVSMIKTAGASYLLGDVIDLEMTGLDVGKSADLWLVISTGATEIITGGSAGALTFSLCSDAQAAIAVDGSQTTHFTTGSLVTDDAAANSAALNAGGIIAAVKLPIGAPAYERYLGIVCTVTTTNITAGTVNAYLTRDPSAVLGRMHYPDAVQ